MVVRPQDNCIRLGNVVVPTFGHDLLPNRVWLANCGQRPALKGTFEKALVDSGGAKLRAACRALALTFTEESRCRIPPQTASGNCHVRAISLCII